MLRVSQALGLELTRPSRFVDVDLENDTPVFIDPLKLVKSKELDGQQAIMRLRTFFSTVLSAVANDEPFIAEDMIANLQERAETRLGVCKSGIQGRGAGRAVGQQFVKALQRSLAVKSGLVTDIMDVAVFIDRVGPDIVSDIITNLILSELCRFTERVVCEAKIASNPVKYPCWSSKLLEWSSFECRIPQFEGVPVVLVPHDIVSQAIAYTPDGFESYSIRRSIGLGADAVNRLLVAAGLEESIVAGSLSESSLASRLAEARRIGKMTRKAQCARVAGAVRKLYSAWKIGLGAQSLSPTDQELQAIQNHVRRRLAKHRYLPGVTRPSPEEPLRTVHSSQRALPLPSRNWLICSNCHIPVRRSLVEVHAVRCLSVTGVQPSKSWVECTGCSDVVLAKRIESHQAKCRAAKKR